MISEIDLVMLACAATGPHMSKLFSVEHNGRVDVSASRALERTYMARWIKLEKWALAQYGDDAPDTRTLRRWAREGHFCPPAEQHGKCWYVSPDAKYSTHNGNSIVDRMRSVYGSSTT